MRNSIGVFVDASSPEHARNPEAEKAALLKVVTEQIRLGNSVQKNHGSGTKIKQLARILKQEHGLVLKPETVEDHLLSLQKEGKMHWRESKGGKNGWKASYLLGRNPNSVKAEAEMLEQGLVQDQVKGE